MHYSSTRVHHSSTQASQQPNANLLLHLLLLLLSSLIANEDVRVALLSCLGLWLARCTAPLDAATTLLAAGIKDSKDVLRRAHMRCAAQVRCLCARHAIRRARHAVWPPCKKEKQWC